MEWTSIEKKWHEMTRRLQNAGAAVRAGGAAGAEGARGTPAPTPRKDDLGIHDMDARALA